MAAKDYIATAANEDFAGRVLYAAFKYSLVVLAEGTGVTNHIERIALVKRVARGDDRPKLIAIHIIAQSTAIRASIDAAPTQLGANVTDADIDTAMAAIWTPRAMAFV